MTAFANERKLLGQNMGGYDFRSGMCILCVHDSGVSGTTAPKWLL